jgi:hypothetical protein
MTENVFVTVGKEIGELVREKNSTYNNSLNSVGEILKILYPNGIKPEEYNTMSTIVRMLDKLKRLSANANDLESWKDLCGYSILKLGLSRK